MARIPQITRTIQTTRVNVLCVNIEDGEPCNQEFILPRTYKGEKAMLKVVTSLITDDNIRPVHVVESEVVETLYGMSEAKFIELAEKLPARK